VVASFFATFSHGSILVCVALSVILVEHWQESYHRDTIPYYIYLDVVVCCTHRTIIVAVQMPLMRP